MPLEAIEDQRLTPIPDEIESSQGKLVYLSLLLTDGATVTELQETLSLKKITVLSVLDSLASRGLVQRTGGTYVPA